MGVHGLWKLLDPSGRVIDLESLSTKRLAIDASIWLIQFVKAMRDDDGNMTLNAPIIGVFRRVCKLLFHKIRPVFVFDGPAPYLKKRTLKQRRAIRNKDKASLQRTAEQLVLNRLHLRKIHAAKDKIRSARQMQRQKVLDDDDDGDDDGEISEKSVVVRNEVESSSDDGGWWSDDDDIHVPPGFELDPEVIANLPMRMQYRILKKQTSEDPEALRLKLSEETNKDPAAFSSSQLSTFLKNCGVKRRINEIRENLGTSRDERGQKVLHIASEADRGIVLFHRQPQSCKKSANEVTDLNVEVGSVDSGGKNGDDEFGDDAGGFVREGEGDDGDTVTPDPVVPFVSSNEGYKPSIMVGQKRSQPSADTCRVSQEFLSVPTKDVKRKRMSEPLQWSCQACTLLNDDSALVCTLCETPRIAKRHVVHGANNVAAAADDDDDDDNASTATLKLDALVKPSSPPPTPLSVKRDSMNNGKEEIDEISHVVIADSSDERPRWSCSRCTSLNGMSFLQCQVCESPRAVSSSDIRPPDGLSRKRKVVKPRLLKSFTWSVVPSSKFLEKTTTFPSVGVSSVARARPLSPPPPPPVSPSTIVEEPVTEEPGVPVTDDGEPTTAVQMQVGEFSDDGDDDDDDDSVTAVGESRVVLSQSSTRFDTERTEANGARPYFATGYDYGRVEAGLAPLGDPTPQEDELNRLEQNVLHQQHQLQTQQKSQERDASEVTDEMIEDTKTLLQLCGIPYIVSPAEAEAQCAELERLGLVDGVVTEDSDTLLFGATNLYRNLFDQKKSTKWYNMDAVEAKLGLNREKLICLALLLGSDYTLGIQGIGPVNAMEIIHAFPGSDGLGEFRNWIYSDERPTPPTVEQRNSRDAKDVKHVYKYDHRSKVWEVSSNFPDEVVINGYLRPRVDDSNSPFEWGRADMTRLAQFCSAKFHWDDETIKPLLDSLAKGGTNASQSRLDSYFPNDGQFAHIESVRISKVVSAMTGNESIVVHQKSRRKKKSAKKAPTFTLEDAPLDFSGEVFINSAPVLCLWASLVSCRVLGLSSWEQGCTFGYVYKDRIAQKQAARLGIRNASAYEMNGGRSVMIMGERLPFVVRDDCMLAVNEQGKVVTIDRAMVYLEKKFDNDLFRLQTLLSLLLKAIPTSMNSDDMQTLARQLYFRFKPKVPKGRGGYGKRGVVSLDAIRRMTQEDFGLNSN